MAVTETWLKPGVADSELLTHTPGYTLFRQDRKGRTRGGVCLFLRDDMTGEVVNTFSNGVCEVLIVDVLVHQVNKIVTVIYCPPDTKLAEFAPVLKIIDEVFGKLPTTSPTITVLGDFNLPRSVLTWSTVDGVLHPTVAGHRDMADYDGQCWLVRQQAAQFCELATKYQLTQQVGDTTREGEILDPIWSSNPDLVSTV